VNNLTFKSLLKLIENNPLGENSRAKYVRHRDKKRFLELSESIVLNILELEDYQREQSKDVFKNLDYIISFIGFGRKKSLFWGVFKVHSGRYNPEKNHYEYELEEMPQFNELKFRLVIDWGDAERSWHQHYHHTDKKVIELYPDQPMEKFPGYEYINLSWKELKYVIDIESWKTALQNQKAVYLITDIFSGKMYVGSAYGENMLLNRWQNYIKSGHGGNIELEKLSREYIENHFRFSILDIFKSTTDDQVIFRRESWWKNTLLTRTFGYNAN
jgi:hypothetical protein